MHMWRSESRFTWKLDTDIETGGCYAFPGSCGFKAACGDGNHQLCGPTGLTVSPVTRALYVADTGNNRVQARGIQCNGACLVFIFIHLTVLIRKR